MSYSKKSVARSPNEFVTFSPPSVSSILYAQQSAPSPSYVVAERNAEVIEVFEPRDRLTRVDSRRVSPVWIAHAKYARNHLTGAEDDVAVGESLNHRRLQK
jgi:hypothetical protein